MARNQETISCPVGDWTQLTNGNVSTITFQVLSGVVSIRYTADATKPTEEEGLAYSRLNGELKQSLSDLVNLAGAARVWAKPRGFSPASVYVDHA